MHKRKVAPTETEPILLTIPEVAALLRVGTTKVYELIKVGELPAVPLGQGESMLRVYVNSLHHWIQHHELVSGQPVVQKVILPGPEASAEKQPTPMRRNRRKEPHA